MVDPPLTVSVATAVTPEIIEMLGPAVGAGSTPDLTARAHRLAQASITVAGYRGSRLVAAACIDINGADGRLTAIGVSAHARRKGFGRSLVAALPALLEVTVLIAETDADAVGFYRALGFAVTSLGQKYPGVERFECRLRVDPDGRERRPVLFRAGTDPARAPLVLLHGSDGSELDLMPLAEDVAPGATRLGIRGTVTMEGGYGFFRRHPDRRVDEDDLASRAIGLVQFLRETCVLPGWTGRPLAVGYSNGAIMTAALMMTDPGLLAGAVLMRPLRPFQLDPEVRLDGIPVLMIDGKNDERRAAGDGRAAADQIQRLGAEVTRRVLSTASRI